MKNKFLKGLLIIGVALFAQSAALADFSFNDMELKFAQISDSHISNVQDTTYKVLSHSTELLNSAIKDVNNIKGLNFVAITGDMVNEPTKQNYKDFLTSMADLNYPAIFVFGNHDSLSEADNEEYLNKSAVLEILENSNPYQNYGKPYFAFSPNNGYRVIVLDTTDGYEGKSNGYLTEEQAAFLDSEIGGNYDKVIIIFQHHPLIEPFKSADHKILNSDDYMAILKKYPKTPIAIFAGHYHCAKITTKGNIVHVTSPSLVTYPNAFRTVKITNYNDRVIFNFNFHETKLKNVQDTSKAGLIATAVFHGLPSDRNTEVMIRKGYVPKKEKLSKEEIKELKMQAKLQREQEKAKRKAEKQAAKEAKKAAKAAKKEKKN